MTGMLESICLWAIIALAPKSSACFEKLWASKFGPSSAIKSFPLTSVLVSVQTPVNILTSLLVDFPSTTLAIVWISVESI